MQKMVGEETSAVRQPVKPKLPEKPGPEEVELHNLTHMEFAPWCQICVDSRAEDDPHLRQPDRSLASAPRVGFDYAEVGFKLKQMGKKLKEEQNAKKKALADQKGWIRARGC